MLKATLETIAKIVDGNLITTSMKDRVVEGVSTDTRDIEVNNLFIPLVGGRFDGHNFAFEAIKKGAIATLWDKRHPTPYLDAGVIIVDDTLQAYQKLASSYLKATGAKVIGITGSNGKTGTKDILAAILRENFMVHKTAKNLNNEIGVPKTIMEMDLDDEVVVLEMGMERFGEIKTLTNIARPDIAVITNVGTAHIGEVGSREKILEAKMEITHGLNENGLLIVNGDNDLLQTIKEDHFLLETIGIDNPASLNAYDICLEETKSTFMIDYHNQPYQVTVNVPGKHFVYNALISIQTGLALSIDIKDCIRGVACFELTLYPTAIMASRL